MADGYRGRLREVSSLEGLNALLDSMDLEDGFLSYLARKGVAVDMDQWQVSRRFVLTQLRALVGRYSTLDDNAFYPESCVRMIQLTKKVLSLHSRFGKRV